MRLVFELLISSPRRENMSGRGNFVGWLEMRTKRVCWLINNQGMELLIMGG